MRGSAAIILAAGDGGRLGSITSLLPKPLIRVCGRPLVTYTVESLAAAGVRDLIVVVGYRGTAVRSLLGDGSRWGCSIRYASNASYHGGNGYSLLMAREYLRSDDFLLAMADHLISIELVLQVLYGPGPVPCLAVDFDLRDSRLLADCTRVRVDETGRITAIGKDLEGFDGVDAGLFRLQADIFDYFPSDSTETELSHVIGRYLARPGRFFARDVTGAFWLDVDTPEDLRTAEGRMGARLAAP